MEKNIQKEAFYQLSYGLYLLTSAMDGKDNGCIINTAIQCANAPTRLSVCVINSNLTCEMVKASGHFGVSVLPEDTPFAIFRNFGMQSGRTADKFLDSDECRLGSGLRYYPEAVSVFDCRVVSATDLGSHTLFIGEVEEARLLKKDASPMTYAFYQAVVKPKPEPAEQETGWRCKICGYVYKGEELPENFECPLCHHGPEDFEKIGGESKSAPENIEQGKGEKKMKKWVCTVCGYVYEGENPPAECPVCHAGADKFKEQIGEMKLAAEHEYGIYAKTVKNNDSVSPEDKRYILEQLKSNFTGECSEVGMYLCMARIAHREGYPEIGLYWEKAAFEEAEHAAKFAELLGEELEPNMTASTKKNLAWRVDCEYGATQGKFDLAACAKKNGLDAIHDTVHEMARDEARHGKALEGMLKRYFK